MQTSRNRFRPSLDALESRETPAVVASVVNRTLSVIGDSAANNIVVSLSGSTATVAAAGRSFAVSTFDRVVITAGGGDDTVVVSSLLTKASFVYGGTGNDTIHGGSGNDQVYAGHGNDLLYGRNGNDYLVGNSGSDGFSGGTGTNQIFQGSVARTVANNSFELGILTRVNMERTSRGLSALTINAQLSSAAAQQAGNLTALGNFNHDVPGAAAPTMVDRVDFAGYEWSSVGENIAFGYSNGTAVMDAWMASSGHRANILGTQFTEIGIAVRTHPTTGQLYYVQVFGSR